MCPGISLGISFIQLSHWGPPLANNFSSAHASLKTLVIISSCQVYLFGPYRFSLFPVFSLSYVTLPLRQVSAWIPHLPKSHLLWDSQTRLGNSSCDPQPFTSHTNAFPSLIESNSVPWLDIKITMKLKKYKYLGFIYCIWIFRILSRYLFLYTVPFILATNTNMIKCMKKRSPQLLPTAVCFTGIEDLLFILISSSELIGVTRTM